MECICTARGCGKPFTVPVVYLAKDRPVGTVPDRCTPCIDKERRAEESREERERREAERAATAKRHTDVLAALEQMGANPWIYNTYTLDNFEPFAGREKAFNAACQFTEAVLATRDKYEPVRGLYLVGDTGTAKTELLHCMMKRFVEAGLQPGTEIIYDNALELIERIQDTYDANQSTWGILDKRIRAKVWILDDLGTEKPSPDVVRKLTLIFNRREGRPNAVSSNDHPSMLTDRNPDFFRLLSRFGTTRYRVVTCAGDDGRFIQEVR